MAAVLAVTELHLLEYPEKIEHAEHTANKMYDMYTCSYLEIYDGRGVADRR